MIYNNPPFKGLKNRIPIIVPTKGRGIINQGSGFDGLMYDGTIDFSVAVRRVICFGIMLRKGCRALPLGAMLASLCVHGSLQIFVALACAC